MENAQHIYINDPDNNIEFFCGNISMLRLEGNGDIYVKDKLIENDLQVVNTLRDFITFYSV